MYFDPVVVLLLSGKHLGLVKIHHEKMSACQELHSARVVRGQDRIKLDQWIFAK